MIILAVCVFSCMSVQRTTCSQSSLSLMWVPGIELMTLGLVASTLSLEPFRTPFPRLFCQSFTMQLTTVLCFLTQARPWTVDKRPS